jgi:hypothetical protein
MRTKRPKTARQEFAEMLKETKKRPQYWLEEVRSSLERLAYSAWRRKRLSYRALLGIYREAMWALNQLEERLK